MPWGAIIPEGGDDYELASAERAFVQVKSRRAHLGEFPVSDVVAFVKELWSRHDGASAPPAKLLLVLERGVVGAAQAGHDETALPSGIAAVLKDEANAGTLLAKTRIIIVSSPREASVEDLAAHAKCAPLAAQLCYADLVAKVGKLADDNGMRQAGAYEALSRSDVDAAIANLLAAIDPDVLEQAFASGVCEPVDFLTPINDPEFYLGVDVEPGHLAAGLVAERPAAREAVALALEERGNALVVGPSGAGKSAVMWDAARATRHTVRWFRVRRSTPPDIVALRRLARTFRASPESPIGFVFDDVGHLGAEGWSQLSRETPAQSGVVILGSVREEDVFVLAEAARARQVRPEPDGELAERIWRALRDAGATSWQGWSEPWAMSEGLLLEYAFILTQGERMATVLDQQVAQRTADPTRDDELSILRVAACAGAAGARIDVSRLSAALAIGDAAISRSLHRLVEEHVLARPEAGVLRGIHQLRSEGLLQASHRLPPPLYKDTFTRAMQAAVGDDLERLVEDAVTRRGLDLASVFAAATQRLQQSGDAAELASILRGFQSAYVETISIQWLETSEAKALAPTQITLAARFGVTGIDLKPLAMAPKIVAAASSLRAVMAKAGAGPRDAFLAQLPAGLLNKLATEPKTLGDLERAVAAMIGGALPVEVRGALAARPPDFEKDDLRHLVSLMGTVGVVDKSLALQWVTVEVEQTLLKRIGAEWPWVTSAKVAVEEGACVAAANYWYVAQLHQANAHDDVVELCQALLALIPRADVAASDAVAANGQPVGVGDFTVASKRIPRGNLLPASVPEWNRRWVHAIAERIAAPSYSDYLSRAVAILNELAPALALIFDRHLRGQKVLPAHIEALAPLLNRAQYLTPATAAAQHAAGIPPDQINSEVTRLQNVLHCCANVLLARYLDLPQGAGAYIGWTSDIVRDIGLAAEEEPWAVLAAPQPPSLAALMGIVETLRLLGGEAAVRKQHPQVSWHKIGKTAQPKNALKLINLRATAASDKRAADRQARLTEAAHAIDPAISVHVRRDPKGILPWPPIEVLVLVVGEAVPDALLKQQQATASMLALNEPRVRMTFVPVIKGKAIPDLAVSGHDTLLPAFGRGNEWIEAVGVPILKSPATEAFNHAAAFAGELASFEKLGLANAQRPEAEQVLRSTIVERLEAKIGELEQVAGQLDAGLAADGLWLVSQILSGDIDLGSAAQEHLSQNGGSKDVENIGLMIAALVQAELDAIPSGDSAG